jgi:leucyl aminopeptidase
LKIDVLAEKDLKRKKFGAMLAVAAGSDSKPSLVVLEHNPKKAKKTVALAGKGVTFDSGGINLKPTDGLEGMKMDMSGAAAVAATLITAAKLRLPIRVIGLLPIVENMPSGKATRPGDIVRSYEGKTIEIGNTDAEGRLILIDAMAYALEQYQPDILIDLATLTGACIVALGEKIAGVFTADKELAEDIVQSGEKVFERCWRMPMPEDYKELLKSDFADIKNIGSTRWGGAITAALFLSEFVKDTRWAHVDIAGPAYLKKADSYCGPGGTGFGVRLLYDLLENL